jgi:hypothetical protein
MIANDERRVVLAEQRVHLRIEPARVTELECVPSLREAFERVRQTPIVAAERCR